MRLTVPYGARPPQVCGHDLGGPFDCLTTVCAVHRRQIRVAIATARTTAPLFPVGRRVAAGRSRPFPVRIVADRRRRGQRSDEFAVAVLVVRIRTDVARRVRARTVAVPDTVVIVVPTVAAGTGAPPPPNRHRRGRFAASLLALLSDSSAPVFGPRPPIGRALVHELRETGRGRFRRTIVRHGRRRHEHRRYRLLTLSLLHATATSVQTVALRPRPMRTTFRSVRVFLFRRGRGRRPLATRTALPATAAPLAGHRTLLLTLVIVLLLMVVVMVLLLLLLLVLLRIKASVRLPVAVEQIVHGRRTRIAEPSLPSTTNANITDGDKYFYNAIPK